MHRPADHPIELTSEALLSAYAVGVFPMADDEGIVHWLAPDPRAIIPLDSFKVSRSLRTLIGRRAFDISVNRAFDRVIEGCADRAEGTWISLEMLEAYERLHRLGFAHSVEAWRCEELAGGLYGVSIGGAFFGESMFHRVTDASKVALAALVDRLRDRGFALLDVQFMTEHLRQFGTLEIRRHEYERRLQHALSRPCRFVDAPADETDDSSP